MLVINTVTIRIECFNLTPSSIRRVYNERTNLLENAINFKCRYG